MNAFSYWEMGRDTATQRIVSMNPISLRSGGDPLGTINLSQANMALSAIAQFGIYMEMRKMNQLKQADFEERRHIWISDITQQWIEEHRGSTGVLRDITNAVANECSNMWGKLCENELIDVPQHLILRIDRMTEYLEWNYSLAAEAFNSLVESSNSNKAWLLDSAVSSEAIAIRLLKDAADQARSDWWQGLLKTVVGLPLFLIPFIGPIAGGGTVGYGIGEMIGRLNSSEADFDTLMDKLPLLKFGIAASLLESVSGQIRYLLDNQEFIHPVRYCALQDKKMNISFYLRDARLFYLWKERTFSLKPVALPN